jgi:hypothetical protein
VTGLLYCVLWASWLLLMCVYGNESPEGYVGLVGRLGATWRMLEGGDGTHRFAYLIDTGEGDGSFRLVAHLEPQDEKLCFGIEEEHSDHHGQGGTCGSYVAWSEHPLLPPTGHFLDSLVPISIDGSLLCTRCGNHGFITDGMWFDA